MKDFFKGAKAICGRLLNQPQQEDAAPAQWSPFFSAAGDDGLVSVSREWNIPTIVGRPDLRLSLSLERNPQRTNQGDFQYRFHFCMRGIRHPYDPMVNFKIIELYNPAYVPAIQKAEESLNCVIEKALEQSELSYGSGHHPGVDRDSTEIRCAFPLHPEADVWKEALTRPTTWLDEILYCAFIKTPSARMITDAETIAIRRLEKFWKTVTSGVDGVVPELKQLVSESAHLQPSLHPSAEETLMFRIRTEDDFQQRLQFLVDRGIVVRRHSHGGGKPHL